MFPRRGGRNLYRVDDIFQAAWFVVETYARIPFYRGFFGWRLSRCDGVGFMHGVWEPWTTISGHEAGKASTWSTVSKPKSRNAFDSRWDLFGFGQIWIWLDIATCKRGLPRPAGLLMRRYSTSTFRGSWLARNYDGKLVVFLRRSEGEILQGNFDSNQGKQKPYPQLLNKVGEGTCILTSFAVLPDTTRLFSWGRSNLFEPESHSRLGESIWIFRLFFPWQ